MPALLPTFATLIGQDLAKSLLQRAVARDMLAHAYLFRGPAGVGKKRMALTLAAYSNCTARANDEACGRCPSCRKFTVGSHPDFLRVRPDGAMIKIGQIRALKQVLAFPPLEAAIRVILLEDVHAMRREAANSLLKTLEEPPDNNILILTADESGELLPTIISRCQVIPFRGLPYKAVARVLVEQDGAEPTDAATLAAVAEGSLGRARLLLAQDLLALRRQVVEQLTTLEAERAATVAELMRLAEQCAELKENLPEFLDLLKIWLRDLLLLAGNGPDSLVVSRDLGRLLAMGAERWSSPQLRHRLCLIQRAEQQLGRNCNRFLVCEVLFFGLI